MTAPDEDRRSLEVSLEVAATPEEVWRAIATGPGITAWFVPSEVDERAGGTITMHLAPEMDATGEIVAYEPPRRFAFREEWQPSAEAGKETLATEFLVEARSGGTCVVRIVTSGFGTGPEWDTPLESTREGWRSALETLRVYLEHFPGESCAPIIAGGNLVEGPRAGAWARLLDALGLGEPRVGERVATAQDAPELVGYVELVKEGELLLRLDAPAPGHAYLAAGGPGEEVYTFMRGYLFGETAQEVAAREEPRWREWLEQRFPAPAPAG